jgi:prepilin-type processing-associated H-X9-DG protein
MLLPALNAAREKAKSSSCLSNLKQIGLASDGYYSDYQYYLPSYPYYKMGSSDYSVTWLGDRQDGLIDVKTSILLNYIGKSWKTLICPSSPPNWQSNDDGQVMDGTGYGYNYYGVGTQSYFGNRPSTTGAMQAGVKSVAKPSETVLFADNINAASAAAAAAGNPVATILLYGPITVSAAGVPSRFGTSGTTSHGPNMHFRHSNDTANFTWADGHASSEKMAFPKVLSGVNCQALKIGSIGQIDSDRYFTPLNSTNDNL